MQVIDAVDTRAATTAGRPRGFDALTGEDFLKLLVTQLTNQDPLEPTSNADLLQQLASIRDIQLSTKLSDALETLAGSQRYGSAAALIGQLVSGQAVDETNGTETVSGVVTGIQFTADGKVILQLDTGRELSLEDLETVSGPQRGAESLIGKTVRAADPDNPNEVIEGIVTGVRKDSSGQIALELDTGETVRMRDLVNTA
ncbi:MAG: hypothetical protein IID39_00410 [Planctomycetes bacterium]|nr:hypothetical protein [Planctomycetota bacterium]